jgi:hypothetical protein
MTNLRMGLVGAALLTVMGAGAAAAAPAAPASGLAQADSIVHVQFHRPHRMCRVDVVRRRTPRGWVVSKVRRCR